MRDSLFGIVRDYGKLIRPKTIRTQQDEIADIVCQILGVIADNPILKTDYPVGNGNPPSRRFPIRFRPLCRNAATPVIHKSVRPRRCRRLPVFTAAITRIYQPFAFQTTQCLLIQPVPSALVGDFAIPFKAERFQCVQNMRGGARHFPGRVQVFHTHQPLAAVGTRIGIRSQSGQQRTYVQQTGRAGGEASYIHANSVWNSKWAICRQSLNCQLRRSIRLSYRVFYRRAFVKAQMFFNAGATLLIPALPRFTNQKDGLNKKVV